MKLEKYKLLHEDDDSFKLHDGEGEFLVAKKGLGKKTLEKIQQHFAHGGVVHAAYGAEIPGIVQEATEAAAPLPQAYGDIGASAAPQIATGEPKMDPTQVPWPTPYSLPEDPAKPYEAMAAQPASQQAEPVTELPPKDAFMPKPLPGFGGAATGEIDKASKDAQKAVVEQGNIAARQAQEQAKLQEQHNAQRTALAQTYDQKRQDLQARSDQLFNDISSSKIDPNRLWNKASNGQKVTASIGLILGGIGAGLTHGPNYAQQVVDGAIDRDIDAQKTELGKKQNLLSHYVQQGHDLREAQQLAKADMQDVFAGQMNAAALKFGGPMAQQKALEEAAKIRGNAAQIREQVLGNSMDRQLKAMQINLAQQQMEQAQKLQRQMAGGLTPELLAQLPPDHPLRKSAVLLSEEEPVMHDGKPVMNKDGEPLVQRVRTVHQALNEGVAKKAQDDLETNSETLDKVRELKRFVAQHPRGTWTATDNQNAKTLANDIKLSWLKTQEGVGRLNENEMEMLNEMIADPRSLWGGITGKSKASAEALEKAVKSKRSNLKKAYLLGSG